MMYIDSINNSGNNANILMHRKHATYYINHSYSPYGLPMILPLTDRVGVVPRNL
jgi:hypothetical protein